MKISVVIPCYNSAEYIRRCIDSVLAQSFQPVEIICVNDGSTDNTLAILKEYKSKCGELIHIIDQANSGACKARNAGMMVATGDFIQFLDTDDELVKEKLKTQSEIVEKNPEADIVAGNCTRISEAGSERVEAYVVDDWIGLIRGRLGNTCANLFRKSAAAGAGGWNETLKSSQEADLMFRMLCKGAKVAGDISFNTVVHVRTSGSISASDRAGNLQRFIQLRHDIFEWLRAHGKLTPERQREIAAIMLGSLRMLYHSNGALAENMHSRLYKPNFKVHSSAQNSLSYVVLYRVFGFTGTQKILSLIGR